VKNTLETSGEDVKNTLETSGEDLKNTLEASGEDVKNTTQVSHISRVSALPDCPRYSRRRCWCSYFR
jgi:hypothetical protein